MRKRGKGNNAVLGWLSITAGLVILLTMILPVGFWWFMLGVALISGGLCLRKNGG